MVRFLLGAVAGGLAVWFWREEILEFAQSKTHGVRAGAVDTLQAVEKQTEKVLDRTKEQISSALQAGQRTLSAPLDRSSH